MKDSIFALFLMCAPLYAHACKVALVLGVDVSHSIDNVEYRWQVDGLANALNDPVIASALIELNAHLAVMQWSGSDQQDLTIPWTPITGYDALGAFQHHVQNLKRPWNNSNTAVGEALSAMIDQFAEVPDCLRHVIDFSGDGDNNIGVSPVTARQDAAMKRIMVNGLAIDRIGRSVTNYYYGHVIVGRGAFVVTANGYHDYARAIRKKLIRELLPPSS